MRLRAIFFFALLTGITLLVGFHPYSQTAGPDQKESLLMRTVVAFVEQLHFSPKPMDDTFSKELFKFYLEEVDGAKRFFTQEDIARLNSFEDSLDDAIKSGDIGFFDLSYALFNTALEKTQGYYREILAAPFDFSKKEVFEVDGEKRDFVRNDAELKALWQKYLKYETLNRLLDKQEQNEKERAKNPEIPEKTDKELEQEAREATLKSYDDYYVRLMKIKRSDRFGEFLNAVAAVFDPHTNYFAPIDKQNFDIRFSGRLEGIGATLQTQGDFTRVVTIVVGGPAWKGKELMENDLIMKVAQGDDGEFQDISGMVINDVVQLIRGKKGTKVRLYVKKVDGTFKTISIVREIVEIEDTYARSLLMDGPNGERFGYIYLPSFYADFNDPNGRFCAKDILAELEKLQAENVGGIVLDLRNNGGGSLRDVQRMTGFFIENGPIVQVKSRSAQPEVLRDTDTRVQYAGPLVVMVNTLSASASEILVAALQDYGRAVIVGSPTFGKGTVQRFYNLDNAVPNNPEIQPLGEIKVTTQKFYRINGGTTQLKGVNPDILLPDEYSMVEVGEKNEAYPLAWTQIQAVPYTQNAFKIKNLEELRTKSKARVEKDTTFQMVVANARRLKTQRDDSLVSLNIAEYKSKEASRDLEVERFKDMFSAVVNQNVRNLPADVAGINLNDSQKARNEEFIKSVGKDIYIRESLNILHDLRRQHK
ncbi:MAG: carboxy terminal-processing peptidase [Saprospiraceae bacterium]|jgi:carboxyl-terminal processing protease